MKYLLFCVWVLFLFFCACVWFFFFFFFFFFNHSSSKFSLCYSVCVVVWCLFCYVWVCTSVVVWCGHPSREVLHLMNVQVSWILTFTVLLALTHFQHHVVFLLICLRIWVHMVFKCYLHVLCKLVLMWC